MALTQQEKNEVKADVDTMDNEILTTMLAFIYWTMTTGEIKTIWKEKTGKDYDKFAEEVMTESRDYIRELANARGITTNDIQNKIRDYANIVKEEINQQAKENILLQGILKKKKAQNWLKIGLWIIAIAAVIYLGYLWYQGKLKLAN